MTAPSSAHAAPPIEQAATGLSGRVAGITLLLFLAGGLASTAWAVATGRLDLLPHALTRATFLDGASMRDMAGALARAPLARHAATLERQASWLAVRDLGPQVRQGCQGWLFLAEEFTPHPQADAALAARAGAVVQVRDRLQARGIALAVVLVPDKSRVEASRLCGLHRAAGFDGRLADFGRRLATAGVPVADATAPLQATPSAFLRTDTHWSEAGAQAAAREVADQVQRLGLALEPARQWQLSAGAPRPRPGDLVRLAGLDTLPVSLQPAAESDTRTTFTESAAPAAGGEADLFGDSGLPQVALVGTSFSNTSQFAPFMAAALGTPVGNFARDGGNFWGSPAAYFGSAAFRDTPPRLLLWEIPERTLQMPLAGERWGVP